MTWLTLLLAFVGNSILNISQAGQKLGLALMRRDRRRGALLWVGSLLGTTVAALIGWVAVTIGRVALVGAMAGSGPGLPGRVLLPGVEGEDPRPRAGRDRAHGRLGGPDRAVPAGAPARRNPPCAGCFPTWRRCAPRPWLAWLALRGRSRVVGPVIAGFAGVLGRLRAPVPEGLRLGDRTRLLLRSLDFLEEGHWAHAVANPFTPLWILLSIASMVVIQFAYRHERAVRLIPYFTFCSILVPVLGGVLAFGDRLQAAQWAGSRPDPGRPDAAHAAGGPGHGQGLALTLPRAAL